ncbi:hypothetical protein NC652_037186 [Populus alba x Populus x berolinensis]|nr:hypothetical protein NC652_037186 [Populus alba x Populus x berolinensis]
MGKIPQFLQVPLLGIILESQTVERMEDGPIILCSVGDGNRILVPSNENMHNLGSLKFRKKKKDRGIKNIEGGELRWEPQRQMQMRQNLRHQIRRRIAVGGGSSFNQLLGIKGAAKETILGFFAGFRGYIVFVILNVVVRRIKWKISSSAYKTCLLGRPLVFGSSLVELLASATLFKCEHILVLHWYVDDQIETLIGPLEDVCQINCLHAYVRDHFSYWLSRRRLMITMTERLSSIKVNLIVQFPSGVIHPNLDSASRGPWLGWFTGCVGGMDLPYKFFTLLWWIIGFVHILRSSFEG